MADVFIQEWWQAREIPLIEADWRNIRLYCQQNIDPFEWDRCLYIIRLAPPYAICYGNDCDIESPLLYVGSGSIQKRWSQHRDWLYELGHAIPGGRYEVWVCLPRCRKNSAFYEDIEADILVRFYELSGGYLPYRNRKIEGTPRKHTYPKEFFALLIDSDRRYQWAIYPRGGNLAKHYYKGSK